MVLLRRGCPKKTADDESDLGPDLRAR